ncbi:TauD/TfdA family dioxygenase [Rugamonas sp.]|uniref:TauD/TfdA family dioxygenase n=1 Tax=Rugamonas sp. TaxID=1926287 RepID=UPI0025FF51D7|nr:TauD/TfdA family dioxygenase [Rugamonas sp.]
MHPTTATSSPIFILPANLKWGDDLARVIAIVRHHFDDFNGNGFYPHPREESLQRELLAVPALAGLARAIGASGARGLAITGLGLGALAEADRNAVLYAIALTRGFPTSTDQRTGRVAWDVRARPAHEAQSRFTTFSERVGGADMHTDSSFYPMPEEQFMLYVVKAARCQGGASLLIDVDDIVRALARSAAGRAAFTLLCAASVPFRVPSVYAASDEQLEYHLAPVFHRPDGEDGGWAMRWRYDSICKGLAARPDLGSAPLRAALELVNELVEYSAPRFSHRLPDDTLLWADNHRTLHGRSPYTDAARHLIRIRMSNTPNARRVGPSGIAAD